MKLHCSDKLTTTWLHLALRLPKAIRPDASKDTSYDASRYLGLGDDAIIPYVPPRPPKSNRDRSAVPANNYGKPYVYASLPRVVLDRIVNEATNHGYRVHPGDPKMPSADEDWWLTLNISQGAHVKMERAKGKGFKDTSLSRIFMGVQEGRGC